MTPFIALALIFIWLLIGLATVTSFCWSEGAPNSFEDWVACVVIFLLGPLLWVLIGIAGLGVSIYKWYKLKFQKSKFTRLEF